MLSIFILLVCVVNAEINMLSYDIPGAYILTPNDYGNASSMIVELWGAGGGGSSRCFGGGSDYAGGGGSYGSCQYGQGGNAAMGGLGRTDSKPGNNPGGGDHQIFHQ